MSSPLYRLIQPTLYKMNTITTSPADLLFLQVFDGEYCHPDTIVKYLYIENHYGINSFGRDLYIKQQLARGKEKNTSAITDKFDRLIKSVEENGFNTDYAIGVDKNFYLRDGSHRSAMSLFLNLEEVRVNYINMEYPRNYRYSWFTEHGFTETEIARIKNKADQLMDKANAPLNIVLFGSCCDESEFICEVLKEYGEVISCTQYTPDEIMCYNICRELIDASDLYGKKHDATVNVKNSRIAVIQLKLSFPHMTTAENDEIKLLKRIISYRIPVIKQSQEMRTSLTDKTFVKDSQLFIPLNFYQNSRFNTILKLLNK
ncbi:MAG: hypothetical protein IJN69_05950 [Oscillospiraceae bacterium]|nr:hypothetical protein [Oscillospiraceae bacterium]